MHGSKSRKLMVPGAALAGTVMLLVLAWGHSWSEPAAAADAAMHLEVSSGAKACSEPGDTADYCVRVGMQFQLSTVIDKAPAAPGWLVAQSFVYYDDGGDNLTYQKPTYVTDDIDPNVDCGGLKLGSQTTVGEEVHHSCFAGSLVSPQPQTYTGQFVTMTFTCSAGDSVSTVNLVPRIYRPATPPLSTARSRPVLPPSRLLEKSRSGSWGSMQTGFASSPVRPMQSRWLRQVGLMALRRAIPRSHFEQTTLFPLLEAEAERLSYPWMIAEGSSAARGTAWR